MIYVSWLWHLLFFIESVLSLGLILWWLLVDIVFALINADSCVTLFGLTLGSAKPLSCTRGMAFGWRPELIDLISYLLVYSLLESLSPGRYWFLLKNDLRLLDCLCWRLMLALIWWRIFGIIGSRHHYFLVVCIPLFISHGTQVSNERSGNLIPLKILAHWLPPGWRDLLPCIIQ